MNPPTLCCVAGCDDLARTKSMCRRHYWHNWKHGYPEPHSPAERFWSKVDRRQGLDSCWPWLASRTDRGYGTVKWNGRLRRSHVVAWLITNGEVPEGLELDHLCRDRACCNPAHLEPVRHQVNCIRGSRTRTDIDPAEVERLWLMGKGKRTIGEILGCSWAPVVRIARERGLPSHPPGGQRRDPTNTAR